MTLMRITAPCQVNGQALGVDAIGRLVEVAHGAERLRLLRAGQAVDAPPPPPDSDDTEDGDVKAAPRRRNKQHTPDNKQEILP